VFDTELIGQIRQYLVPLFHKHLEHIPLPPISGSTDDYDFKLENLNFSGTDILPDHIQVNTKSELDVNVSKLETDKFKTQMTLKITDIRTKLEGVHFWFERKAIPRLEDEGIADVDLSGDGASLEILLNLKGNSQDGLFHIAKCDLSIDKLNIDIREAQHQILLNVLSTLFQGTIKRQIEDKVEESFKSMFESIEKGLNDLTKKYSATSNKLSDIAMKIGGFATEQSADTPKHSDQQKQVKQQNTSAEAQKIFFAS